MVVVKRIQKTCQAQGCTNKFAGFPASKFCSDPCRKKGVGKPKFEPVFTIVSPILERSKELTEQEDAKNHPARKILSLPADKFPVTFRKPGSQELISEVKNNLLKSVTLDQIISNIASKHKYKKAESYVTHIEDMLILYAKD